MNEHTHDTTVPTLDNDQIDALLAKLHDADLDVSDAGNGVPSDGDSEAAHEEATFISEDETSKQLN